MAKSRFQYQDRDASSVEKRMADRGGDYDQFLKVDPIKVAEGSNAFRILPPTWDTKGTWGDSWCIDVYLHWNIGSDGGTYICLNKMKGEDCPICEMVSELRDEDQVKELKAKRSLFAYVIDRKNEKAGPQIWRLGKQLENNIHFRSKDKKTGAILPIDHPERGYDISFTRVGTDVKTKYTNEDVDRDPSYLSENEKTEDKWLDYIQDNPLPDQLNYYTYEHMAAVCKGRKSAKVNDDDKPSRSSRDRSSRDEPAEETDTRGSRRRGNEEKTEERSTRRGRDEPVEEETRSSRDRPSRDEPDTRRRSRDEPAEEASTRRRPVVEEETSSRRRPAADEEPRSRVRQTHVDDDEIPSERSSRRTAPKADEDDGEEEPEGESTTSRAKASIKRLQPSK